MTDMQASVESAVHRPSLRGATPAFAAFALAVAVVFVAFLPTTMSMIEIWRNSQTFHHCFAVIPIALWLVWSDRSRLAATPVKPYWPGMVALSAFGFVWLLGLLAAAQSVSQIALVALVSASVLTVFGTGWLRVLWFPLAYLIFAVPIGEAAIPILMDWTAHVTVAALRLSGVPVHQEGMHFVIPSGRWSVIEACSGAKFLVASVMIGSLYAWLMYRSPRRRAAFLMVSIAMPVLANWLRAYSIVMIGHLSQNSLMNNEDHIVFGWVLFSVMLVATFWIGTRWREDAVDPHAPPDAPRPLEWRALGPAALIAVAGLGIWPLMGYALIGPLVPDVPRLISPPEGVAGWHRDERAVTPKWMRPLEGSKNSVEFVYRKEDQGVAVFIGAYQNQTQASQVGSSAVALARVIDSGWVQITDARVVDAGQDAGRARGAQVRNQSNGETLLVWQWYWVHGQWTISPARTKATLALDRLLRRPDVAFWVAVSTPVSQDLRASQAALEGYLREMGPSLERTFQDAAKQ